MSSSSPEAFDGDGASTREGDVPGTLRRYRMTIIGGVAALLAAAGLGGLFGTMEEKEMTDPAYPGCRAKHSTHVPWSSLPPCVVTVTFDDPASASLAEEWGRKLVEERAARLHMRHGPLTFHRPDPRTTHILWQPE